MSRSGELSKQYSYVAGGHPYYNVTCSSHGVPRPFRSMSVYLVLTELHRYSRDLHGSLPLTQRSYFSLDILRHCVNEGV